MQDNNLSKIVIIGPESTGKSTLCTSLAAHYNTIWCPEYAREYLMKNGTSYSFDNLLDIAKGQLNLEAHYSSQALQLAKENNVVHPKLFVDTDMYVLKVWCEYVFSNIHFYILDQIAARPYNLYLLCKPDLPWVKDELREYPNEKPRQELYHMYRDLLIHQKTNWVEISGSYEERLALGIGAVEQFLG